MTENQSHIEREYTFVGEYHHNANATSTRVVEITVNAANKSLAEELAREEYLNYLDGEPSESYEDYSVKLVSVDIRVEAEEHV